MQILFLNSVRDNLSMAETYNIKWRSHAPETIAALNRLRCQGALSDAVVMCRSQVFRAHKLILSLCSEYFEEVFINYPAVSFSRESVFVMHQTNPQLFRLLMDFMYTGEVEVNDNVENSRLSCLKVSFFPPRNDVYDDK